MEIHLELVLRLVSNYSPETIATDLPLEIRGDLSTITTAESQGTITSDESHDSTSRDGPIRPQRKAAVEARRRVQQWCAEDLIDH